MGLNSIFSKVSILIFKSLKHLLVLKKNTSSCGKILFPKSFEVILKSHYIRVPKCKLVHEDFATEFEMFWHSINHAYNRETLTKNFLSTFESNLATIYMHMGTIEG